MEYRNGEYFLTQAESEFLLTQSVHPDKEIMERRNRYFAQIDKELKIEYKEGGSMSIEMGCIK